MLKRILRQIHYIGFLFLEDKSNFTEDKIFNILTRENLCQAATIYKEHGINGKYFDKETAQLLEYLYENEKRSMQAFMKTPNRRQAEAIIELETLCRELKWLSQNLKPAKKVDFQKESHHKKIVLDPVHGNIVLPPLCVAVINTPQFQRLRYLKQMGVTPYVYPGGSHSRFEHSLGNKADFVFSESPGLLIINSYDHGRRENHTYHSVVCYLAGELLKSLRDVHKGEDHVEISKEDEICVQIAGLCHDLGHGPFSHMFDEKFIPTVLPEYKETHEKRSVEMLNHMFRDGANRLVKRFRDYGLRKTDFIFIEEQIFQQASEYFEHSSWNRKGRPPEKSFLYEIVANKRNGVDVDKWDYLARDCHHLGIRSSFDHKRVIRFARIAKFGERTELCLRDKEAYNVYEMYHIRDFLHRFVCHHRVSAVVDIMIVEAMMKANNAIKFRGKDGEKIKLAECVYDMEAFTHLTDNVFYQILLASGKGLNAKDKADLKEARKILLSVHQRRLYKFSYQSPPLPGDEFANENKAKATLLQCLSAKQKETLKEHIYVQLVVLDFGKREENPLRDLHFYKKSDTKVIQAIPLEPHEVSRFLHQKEYREQYVRVFEKPSMDQESRKLLKKALDDFGKIYPRKM